MVKAPNKPTAPYDNAMQNLIIINSMLFLVFLCTLFGFILWRRFVKKEGDDPNVGESKPKDDEPPHGQDQQ